MGYTVLAGVPVVTAYPRTPFLPGVNANGTAAQLAQKLPSIAAAVQLASQFEEVDAASAAVPTNSTSFQQQAAAASSSFSNSTQKQIPAAGRLSRSQGVKQCR